MTAEALEDMGWNGIICAGKGVSNLGINYFLSVIPFLGAVEAGVLNISSDQLTFLPPPKDQMHFCYDVTSCQSSFPDSLAKWKIFFQKAQEPLASWEDLLKYLWAAHKKSIEETGNRFDNRYLYFPKAERDFAKSWKNAVSYIASVRFETTLEKTSKFQKCLPPIFLNSFVNENFTDCQNRVLYLLDVLREIDISTGISVGPLHIGATRGGDGMMDHVSG
ncbi:protein LEG1 homolog [Macrotis lagotis]|uniref:protein LEG1 homolog n=1 Tax=Macrotis lagotis TaxID=92651 RepID=UPI003D6968E0